MKEKSGKKCQKASEKARAEKSRDDQILAQGK
jgi:hypothetical protein